jgi:GNAT acetyltransferase-like protein
MTIMGSTAELVGGCRVEVAPGVAHLDREAWNDVVRDGGGSVFHTWEWLAAFEEAPPGDFEPAHLLAYEGGSLVGVCPAYLVRRCPRLDYAASLAGIEFGGPVLLAHSLAAFAGGPLVRPGNTTALDALLSGMRDTAESLDAWAWGFANLPAGPLTGRLLGSGYAVAQLSTTYLLDTGFASTEDYWKSFRSKHRRELSRERRVLEQRGTRITETSPNADEYVRLVQALVADHGTPLEVLPEDFLRALHRHLAPYDRTHVTVEENGEVVALFASYEFGAERSLWLAGLDVSRFDSFDSYRPMLATAVESAISGGTALMNLGRGNAAPKRRLGATAAPLYLALNSPDRRRNAQLHAACRELEFRSHAGTDGLDVVSRCC